MPTTQPEEIEQYGIRVADAWKLGRKGVDDGAILMVAKNDRRVRIEVGYGLEGALPDAIANRIIDETITPHFKQGDYDGGIEAGVDQMISVVDGEPLPEPDQKWENRGIGLEQCAAAAAGGASSSCSGILRALFGRLFGSLATGGLAGVIAWLISHRAAHRSGCGGDRISCSRCCSAPSRGWVGGRRRLGRRPGRRLRRRAGRRLGAGAASAAAAADSAAAAPRELVMHSAA